MYWASGDSKKTTINPTICDSVAGAYKKMFLLSKKTVWNPQKCEMPDVCNILQNTLGKKKAGANIQTFRIIKSRW